MTDRSVAKNNQNGRSLQELHEELRIILDSVPAWVFYKDKENHFLRVNTAFCDVMGMSKEELEGRSLFDLYPIEQAEAFWKDDMDVIASGTPKRNIVEPMDRKGERLWVLTDKIPYRNGQGDIIGIIGFGIDITARKNAEDELRAAYAEEKRLRQEHEELVDQLKSALANIRTLQSCLPVCAVCKKIRDEKGAWHHIETFISSRTDTQFTHGYCPECADKVREGMHPRPTICDKCGNGMELLRYVDGGHHYRRYYCKKCGFSQDFVRKKIEGEAD